MATFVDQDISFASGRSRSSQKPRVRRIQPYVSPFVEEAKRRAEQRVREKFAKASNRRKPSPPRTQVLDNGEWNNSVQTPGLFDPQLRKQEIFRLGPKGSRQSTQENRLSNDTTQDERKNSSRPSSRMTIRSQSDFPRRSNQQYNNRESLRDSEDNNPELTVSRPKSSGEIKASQHPRVTRSTSPIDDRIMKNIYDADNDYPDSSQFTLRQQNEYPRRDENESKHRNPQSTAAFQQFLREHGRGRENMDPQALREHYGNMIRDRLRQLLQQHREGKGDVEEGNADPSLKPYPYFSRLRRQGSGSGVMGGFFRPADMVDTQMMTRDLMASMAQIMTAVGEIVTNQQQSQQRKRRSRKDWYKDHPVPRSNDNSYGKPSVASEDPQQMGPSSPAVIAAARMKTPGKAPISMSELAALSAAKGISKLREKEKEKEAAVKTGKDASRKEFMWDMAQALRPEVMLQEAVSAAENGVIDPHNIPLPKNKAAVFDMIFSKLQSIEKCERDLIDFLQEPREAPLSAPVDPVVDSIKRRQRQASGPVKKTTSAAVRDDADLVEEEEEDIPSPPPLHPQSKVVDDAKSAANATYDFLKRYPPLGTISSCLRSDFEDYKEKLDRARRLRDAVFLKKHSDLATTADTVADAICDRIIGSVASEIGGFVEDYSKNYVRKL